MQVCEFLKYFEIIKSQVADIAVKNDESSNDTAVSLFPINLPFKNISFL